MFRLVSCGGCGCGSCCDCGCDCVCCEYGYDCVCAVIVYLVEVVIVIKVDDVFCYWSICLYNQDLPGILYHLRTRRQQRQILFLGIFYLLLQLVPRL